MWCRVLLVCVALGWLVDSAPSGQRLGKHEMLVKGMKTLREEGVGRGTDRVHRYMLNLYSQYLGQDVMTATGTANTVRSVSAEIGLVNGDSMFVFNLTAIDSTEDIVSSEVHIYRKKRRSDLPLTISLYELAPSYITELGKTEVREGRSGWQVVSVTDAVKSCLATRRPNPHILALGFSQPKAQTMKRLQLKAFMHHLSRPYLVVHSNSNVNLTEDHIHARLTRGDTTFINPESGRKERFRPNLKGALKQRRGNAKPTAPEHTKPVRTSSAEQESKTAEIEDDNLGYKQEVLRRKLSVQKKHNEARQRRSILTNEIPEDPSESLEPKQKSNKNRTQKHKIFSMDDFDFSNRKEQRLQSQENRKKRRRKQKNKGGRNKNKKQTNKHKGNTLPSSPEEWGLVTSQLTPADNKLCASRKLVLDFMDIGWSNWIIAPKAFESNYCAGKCPYPAAQQTTGLSNHATLQSLVHAVAINPEVPPPCCVPAEMTSLSVLYYDQYGNVVLKNYPNMAVKSCECR